MGLEAAHQNMESGLAGTPAPEAPQTDLAPESAPSSSETAPESSGSAPSIQDLIDLDKIEKFKMHGEEWTRDKLASSMLRQADYTRKTQELGKERGSFAKEQKYYENLSIDIANILKDPSLVDKFKQIYPQKFHQYLDNYSGYLKTSPKSEGQAPGSQPNADPQLLARVNQIEGRFRAEEVKTASVMLDGLFKQQSEKFPFADEASVISRSLALMEQKQRAGEKDELSQDEWTRIFKSENDRVQKLAEGKYKETVDKQLKANRKAKDVGVGGDSVGQAPKRLTMKEATEAAIRDLTRQ